MINSSWKQTARTIVLSIILGGASGVLFSALTTNYLSGYAIELGQLTNPLRLQDERPHAFPKSYEEALEYVSEIATPSLVSFFEPSLSASDAYLSEEAVLHGMVLTSDGWIMTNGKTRTDLAQLKVGIGREVYQIVEIVPDSATGVSFVKIEAENLSVLAFGKGRDIMAGERVFVVPSTQSLLATTVIGSDWGTETIWSADIPQRKIILSTSAESSIGAPVTNTGGELIGIMQDDDKYIPMESLLPAFTSLLRDGDIERASLGLEVIDLTHSIGLSEELVRSHRSGALILNTASIVSNGSAAQAQLQAGDIILMVDGQLINGNRSLDEYISDYRPGDNVRLTIDRAGEEIDITVTLGVL